MDAYRGGQAPSPELGHYQLRQAVLQTLRSIGLRPSGTMGRETMEAAVAQLAIAPGDLVFVDTECPDFLAFLLSGLAGDVAVALAPPLDGSLSPEQLLRLQDNIGRTALSITGSNRFADSETAGQRRRAGSFKQLRHGFGGRLRQGVQSGGLAVPVSASQFLSDPLWLASCGEEAAGAARAADDLPPSTAPCPGSAGAAPEGGCPEKKRGRGRPRKYPLPTAAIWWTSIPAADKTTMAFWDMNRHLCGAIGLPGTERAALFLLSPEETTAVEMGQLTPQDDAGGTAAALESRRVGFGEIFANGKRYCPDWYLDPQNTCGEAPLEAVTSRIGRGTTLSGKNLPLEGPLPQCPAMIQRAQQQPPAVRPSWMPRTATYITWGNLLEPTDCCYLEASGIHPNGSIHLQRLAFIPPQQERYTIAPEDGPVLLLPRDGGSCALAEAPCPILLANNVFALRFPSGDAGEEEEAPRRRGRKPKPPSPFGNASSPLCAAPLPAYVEVFLQSEYGRALIGQLPKPLGKSDIAALPIPLLSEEMQREVIERDAGISRTVAREAERAERVIAIMEEAARTNRFEA